MSDRLDRIRTRAEAEIEKCKSALVDCDPNDAPSIAKLQARVITLREAIRWTEPDKRTDRTIGGDALKY